MKNDCYSCQHGADEESGIKDRVFLRCMAEGPRKGRVVDIYIGKRPPRIHAGVPKWCPGGTK